MKKLLSIAITAILVCFLSCNKAEENLVLSSPVTTITTPEVLDNNEVYVRTIRDNMRLDMVLSLPNAKYNATTATTEILNGILTDLEKVQGKAFANDVRKVIKNEQVSSFINSIGSNLTAQNARTSGKSDIQTIFKNAPAHINKSTGELTKRIAKSMADYEDKIKKNSDQPDKNEVENALKKTISQYEEDVIKDKSLTTEQKKDIFSITSWNYANAANIAVTGITLASKAPKNGKIEGFWSSFWNIVVTIVVYTVAGMVAGMVTGGLIGLAVTWNPAGGTAGAGIDAVVGFFGGLIAVISGECICWDSQYGGGQFEPYTCAC